jgi:hypothetical protein
MAAGCFNRRHFLDELFAQCSQVAAYVDSGEAFAKMLLSILLRISAMPKIRCADSKFSDFSKRNPFQIAEANHQRENCFAQARDSRV